jgi:hypothetical protein
VRTFADPSFFRLIHALLDEAHSHLRRTKWTHRGVNWQRQRHSFTSSETGFAIDQYLITKSGSNGWTLLVVKEMWWDGSDKPIRSTQWGKPLSGSRAKALEWLRAEERRINGQVLSAKTAE